MSRPKGSKNKQKGPSAPCPICFKEFKVQGMGTHLRERHNIVYNRQPENAILNQPENDIPDHFYTPSGTGEHKQRLPYTPMDLFILKGKLYEASLPSEGAGGRLRKLSYVDKTLRVKMDFEKRFHKSYQELCEAHPEVFPTACNPKDEFSGFADCLPYARRKYSDE